MKLEPIITEKTTQLATQGKYTFRVEKGMTKHQIKKLVGEVFDVHVKRVWTANVAGEKRRTMRGRKRVIMPTKKAIVALAEKEKIDAFEIKSKG